MADDSEELASSAARTERAAIKALWLAFGDCCALVLPVGEGPPLADDPEPRLPAMVEPPDESPSELPVRVEPDPPALDMPLPATSEDELPFVAPAPLCEDEPMGARSRDGPDEAAAPDESVEPPVLPMIEPEDELESELLPEAELPADPEPRLEAVDPDPDVDALPLDARSPLDVVAPYPLLVPPPVLVEFEEPVTPVAPEPEPVLPY